MLYGITLIILGILAIPSLVLAKKPDAKELIDKIVSYQGWIGLIFCIWGVWGIISCFLSISWISVIPVYWVIWLLVSIVEAALGFIMGYSLITKYALSKNPAAAEKGEKLLATLIPLQGKLGVAAIILGIVQIIASVVWVVA